MEGEGILISKMIFLSNPGFQMDCWETLWKLGEQYVQLKKTKIAFKFVFTSLKTS